MRVPLSPALLILLTLSLHAAPQPGSGSTATPPELPLELTLQSAVSLALAHSPRLKRSEEMVIQQDHRIREIKATRRPRLNASGGYTQYDEDRLQNFGDFGDVDDSRWDANLEASITVFSGGRHHNAVKGELSRYAASESSFESSREDLLASIHKTYYDAELAQQTIAVREEAIAVLSEQLAFSGNRLKADVGERFDVLQAEVALSSARPPLIRAQNDYRRHLDRLRRLLGMQYPAGKDANDIRLRAAPEPTTPALDIEAAAQRAVAQRAELAQLDALIRAAHYDLKVLRREQAPTVDLFAGYGI
jgi:outer membrane protein TolC